MLPFVALLEARRLGAQQLWDSRLAELKTHEAALQQLRFVLSSMHSTRLLPNSFFISLQR